MAEASGLVIGAVGLASLFSTCMDLFDRFDLGKNYPDDYKDACSRLALLKERFSRWGVALRLDSRGLEEHATCQELREDPDAIERGLSRLISILEDASLLAEKHQLISERPHRFRNAFFLRQRSRDPVIKEAEVVTGGTTSQLSSRKRTLWALHDKQKFDEFITSLTFCLDNLEKLKYGTDVLPVRIKPLAVRPALASKSSKSSVLSNRTEAPTQKEATTPGGQAKVSASRHSEQAYKKEQAAYLQQLASQMCGHIFMERQEVVNGVGLMGNVGKTKDRHVYAGGQSVSYNGLGVMGNVSAKAVRCLRELKATSSVHPDVNSEDSEDESKSESG